ncbi:uncharacterized protein B0J16DRAFT_309116 [Fusarium flagelliforme]|uniref:uncharacterized protein n=1 Tax=Fusarium flagelliforme TaxID=2675880 RepID=UPI001E8DD789|nr:uncharacterized protein B0J16DRAFT_309116 [Fusarium flagelliforme]KAH7179844.1 hypothetical protein B0J16DRAFT_309116 [Fusarium flagelliforme]
MAELALAIIPIGLKACSGLVSYLSGLKDRDDALARLTRQAESLEGCFRLLDASFKQGHLDPTRYRAVPHIIVCLRNCEEGLNDLKEFEQTQKTQNRLEHSLQKLRFPLRKAHLEELETILDRLCQPLSLAIQSLQLSVSYLPLLQDSVDNLIPQIIPQINLVIETRLQAQTENIRQALQEAEVAAIRRHCATTELLSQLTTPSDGRVSSLNSAIQFSFCTNTGAGGFAISPSLMYFGVVDRYAAPAFQVLSLPQHCSVYRSRKMDQEVYLKAMLHKLQEVFGSGRAKPTDIDQDGETLLHMISYQATPSPNLEALFDFLIAIGTPLDIATASTFAVSASVLGKLCFEDAEIHTPAPFPWFLANGSMLDMMAEYDRESKRVTEALYGPLVQAIIRCDEDRAKELISTFPECIGELNIYGTNALHLAVEQPAILKLITSKATPTQLVQWNLLLRQTMTPLSRVMEISGLICKSEDVDAESRCPCVAAAYILLDADCPIIPRRDFIRESPAENLFASASKHCKELVAQALRSRRCDLREMAQQRLPKTECGLIDSSAGELDFYAIEVDRKLSRKNLTRFGRHSTIIQDDISYLSREEPVYWPVYLSLVSPEDASIFFDLGFLDIDHLPVLVKTGLDYPSLLNEFMTHWMSQYWGLEGFDFVLADITGRCFDHYYRSNIDEVLKGLGTTLDILDNKATDNCSCLCAPGGCSPFDVIARWLSIDSGLLSPRKRIGLVMKHHGESLQPDQLVCLIRQATFEALGMTHTCLDTPRLGGYTRLYPFDAMSREDEEEASEDDYDKLVYLDELLAEFENFMLSRSKPLEHKLTGGSDIPTAQSDDEHAGSHALVFWNDIWPYRVDEIKKHLEATWDPDVEILNELGVSLWFEDEKDDMASETSEDEQARLFNEFMVKLDMI